MVRIIDFINYAKSKKITKRERSFLSNFLNYCSKENLANLDINHFGNFEFLQYHSYLNRNKKSIKSIYNIMVALRRLMLDAYSQGYKFTTNPKYFSTPKKPNPNHFEPLSDEEHEILKCFLTNEITKIYEREKLFEDAIEKGVPINESASLFKKTSANPRPPSFYKWNKPLKDSVLQYYKEKPAFPHNTTEKQLAKGGEYASITTMNYDLMNSPFKLLYKRFGIQRLKSSTPFLIDRPEFNHIDALGVIYPRFFEYIVISLAIGLETGWSQDTIERIDINDYLYNPVPIKSDLVFIKSIKTKGMDSKNDILEAKEFVWPSSLEDPLSAYNLIKLFIKRTSRLREGIHYEKEVNSIGNHPFIVYLNDSTGVPILAKHPDRPEKKNTYTKTKYLTKNLGFNVDYRQIRPTCLYLRERDQDLPLLLQIALFGHSSSAVTDKYYKNNSAFKQLRKDRLATELNKIQSSIHDGSFKGRLVPLKQKKSIDSKIITIFTDQGINSPLAICNNNKNPDWPGHQLELKYNNVCRRFNKCLLCSQSSVFSDNIPFIVDRYLFLEKQFRELEPKNFEKLYGCEYSVAKEVIENWPYEEDISAAEERVMTEGHILPPIIAEMH